jgi:hypothetical protein
MLSTRAAEFAEPVSNECHYFKHLESLMFHIFLAGFKLYTFNNHKDTTTL